MFYMGPQVLRLYSEQLYLTAEQASLPESLKGGISHDDNSKDHLLYREYLCLRATVMIPVGCCLAEIQPINSFNRKVCSRLSNWSSYPRFTGNSRAITAKGPKRIIGNFWRTP